MTDTPEDKARADADEMGQKLDRLLSGIDSLAKRMNDFEAQAERDASARHDATRRRDAAPDPEDEDGDTWEGQPEDERERMTAAEMRAMRSDRQPGDPEPTAADAAAGARKRFDNERASESASDRARRKDNVMAHHQARADAVLSMDGKRAPPPLSGETVRAYRARLLRDLLPHSPSYRAVDLFKISDATIFGVAENQIRADAAAAFKSPQIVAGEAPLRMIEKHLPSGHLERTFIGSSGEFVNLFSGMGRLAHITPPGMPRS